VTGRVLPSACVGGAAETKPWVRPYKPSQESGTVHREFLAQQRVISALSISMDSPGTCEACVHPGTLSNPHHQPRRPPTAYPAHCALEEGHCTERCIVVTCDEDHIVEGVNPEDVEKACVGHECESTCDFTVENPNSWPCGTHDCSFEELVSSLPFCQPEHY